MKRSVVEERMDKVLASRVGFKKKFPDSTVAQERFTFNKMWIEYNLCICKESGCDWDREKNGKRALRSAHCSGVSIYSVGPEHVNHPSGKC